MKKRILVLGIIFTAVFAVSCEEDDVCVGEGTPNLTVVFRTLQTQENLTDTLFVERVTSEGELIDTLYKWLITDSIKLPLGGLDESVNYFRIKLRPTGQSDILTVNYTPTTSFVSKACGFRLTYDDLDYESTENAIRNLTPSESNVLENEAATNLYIYYNN
ncbi:hypothetical protein SAMN06296427_102246 [Moheibacter sediminis]|uniref:Uncharacterized protein n=2 Tax=Moheibacter sediminis TaxID=1434700 RepID=A0A1W1Z6Y0_9FLAO|nr:hypothetical protein SAMN06296427_102246 [Moheibacter sediminis]